MARKLRMEYPGAIYHGLNRGDRREDIFHDDEDRESFLSTLAEACAKADWRVQAQPEDYGRIRRGWCRGEEAFRKELLAQVEEKRGASHYGAELQERATEKAERLMREGLQKLGWPEAELATRPKGDRAKVKLALKLRAETTMTLKWIAAWLQMGTGASLSNLLSAQRRGKG